MANIEDPKYVEEYIKSFGECLEGMQLPPLKDRREQVKTKSTYDKGTNVTIAILSRPSTAISALIEGARQHRESVFLVLSHTWLERKGEEMYLHKGIWMNHETSQAFLDFYSPPRRVTYFANFFTKIATYDKHDEGEHLAKGLKCPMSLINEDKINDKLWTKAALARGMVSFPDTLAFALRSKNVYNIPEGGRLKVRHLADLEKASLDIVDKAVTTFVRTKFRGGQTRIVVKRGGPSRVDGVTLGYYSAAEPEVVVKAVIDMLQSIPDGDSVMVEDFLHTMPSHKVLAERLVPLQRNKPVKIQNSTDLLTGLQDHLNDDFDEEEWENHPLEQLQQTPMAFTVRIVSSLSPTDEPTAGSPTCFVGPSSRVPTHSQVLPFTLDQVLLQWGMEDRRDIDRITATLFSEAERVHNIIVNELDQGTGSGSSDVISVDFVLALKGALVMPFVIRVHDHDTFIMPQRLDELLNRRGQCAKNWVERMLSRSQDKVLHNRTVLIVGGGGFGKLEMWEIMEKLHLRVVLADNNANHIAKDRVWKFVHVPSLTDHSKDEDNAKEVLAQLKAAGIEEPEKEIDGVSTTYDPCVVVASHVARMLGKHGNDPLAHDRAKNKLGLAKFLKQAPPMSKYHSRPGLYVAESVKITCTQDIRDALEGKKAVMTLPAVLKNSHGMCGMGVKLVRSVEDAVAEYEKMEEDLKRDLDSDWTGLSFGGETFLMEYLDGTEHDVDIVMFKGELICALVTDNGPTRLPYFNETCAAMPSRRHQDEVSALIAGAHACARAADLHTGVYNVEMKYTSQGPRLIEINARLGGFYLTNWAQRVFNVNLIRCVVQVACGIRPVIKDITPPPRTYCVGLQLYNSQHGSGIRPHIPKDEAAISYEERMAQNRFRKLDAEGVIIWIAMAAVLKETPMEWEGAFANIGCSGKNHEEAAAKLLSIVRCMDIDADAALKTDYFIRGLGIHLDKTNKSFVPVGPAK